MPAIAMTADLGWILKLLKRGCKIGKSYRYGSYYICETELEVSLTSIEDELLKQLKDARLIERTENFYT